MHHGQIALVRDSFSLLQPMSADVAARFYENLFSADPTLQPLFRGDLSLQGERLMGMIASAIGLLDTPDQMLIVLRHLGARHAGYGVKDRHYNTVGSALLKTLEDGLGDGFTADIKEAWVELYATISHTMRDGSRQLELAA